MTTHSSILAWEILWTEEPGGLQFMGLQRVRYNWATEHACMPHLWIHPWLVLTLLAYLYVSWTKQTNKQKNYHVALGPSILSTWKAFHAFIWSHSTICWKFLSQGLRSRPISPDMAISFVISFPETHWFGVSIGYMLYVKCSAILLSTLPPIAYNRCCLITFFFQSDCGTLRCVPVPGRIFTKQFWHWDQELHYPQHVQAYSDIYREFTEFSITFLWILCTP